MWLWYTRRVYPIQRQFNQSSSNSDASDGELASRITYFRTLNGFRKGNIKRLDSNTTRNMWKDLFLWHVIVSHSHWKFDKVKAYNRSPGKSSVYTSTPISGRSVAHGCQELQGSLLRAKTREAAAADNSIPIFLHESAKSKKKEPCLCHPTL